MILGHAPATVTKAIQAGRQRRAPVMARRPSWKLTGSDDSRSPPFHGAGAAREFGHRGGDERDPSRPRLYQTRRHPKFEGCYHGHSDYLLAKAGSGSPLGIPDCPGVPEDFTKHTLTAPITTSRPRKIDQETLSATRLHHRRADRRKHGRHPPSPEFLEGRANSPMPTACLLILTRSSQGSVFNTEERRRSTESSRI